MKRRKKFILFIFLIIILVLCFMLFINREKDYTTKYKKDGMTINESYNKELRFYYFLVKYKNRKFELGIKNKYLHKKELIKKVNILENENDICLYLKSDEIDTYPSCYRGNKSVSYSLMGEEFADLYSVKKINYSKTEFNSIKVNTLLSKNIAVWNHKGFSLLNSDGIKDLNILENESYYDENSFSIDKYILIPNYDDKYSFNMFYVIDLLKGKVSKWNIDTDLSYNFYYLGEINKRGYIIDKKSSIEYELNPTKKKITIVSENQIGKVYDNGWNEVSMTKLVSNDFFFEKNTPLKYKLKNNNIYLKYYKGQKDILVTNEVVDKLVSQKDDDVYYTVKDKLYHYSPYYGNVEMIQYSEFEFNQYASVYIY